MQIKLIKKEKAHALCLSNMCIALANKSFGDFLFVIFFCFPES